MVLLLPWSPAAPPRASDPMSRKTDFDELTRVGRHAH
jgi:hypothetical protein